MSWDKTLPGNSEKIRNLGIVIRQNFEAIEEADETGGTTLKQRAVILGDRSVIAVSADPTEIAGSLFIYNKQDGGAVEELFIRRAQDTASPIQMTKGPVTVGAEGSTFLPGGAIMKWGTIATSGVTTTTITFATPFPNAIYSVIATPIRSSAVNYLGQINATATVNDFVWRSSGISHSIYWVAIGS